MFVQKNGILYTFDTDKDKSELKFIFSGNIITPMKKEEFEYRNKLAKCYVNHKKLGVAYSSEIMKEISKI
jgi:hypothetical protein